MSTRTKVTRRAAGGTGPGGPRISRLAAAVGLALYGANASAAVFTVTNTNDDDGDGSLRAAVALANATPGLDFIEFDAALAGQTIVVSADRLFVAEDLIINGPGRELLTIEHAVADRALFNLDTGSSSSLTVRDLTFERSSDQALGIIDHDGSDGIIGVERCDLLNAATGSAPGAMQGAIAGSNVSIAVIDSTIDGFQSGSGDGGGAFHFFGNGDDLLAIIDSTISNNSAPEGGAIRYAEDQGGTVSIFGSRFVNNSATAGPGGAIYFVGTEGSQQDLFIGESAFIGNRAASGGGALHLAAEQPATTVEAEISNTLFRANETTGVDARGGAIAVGRSSTFSNQINLRIVNTTLSGNHATGVGGAIATFSEGTAIDIDILNSTITANSGDQGGGIQIDGPTFIDARLVNSIVAGNSATRDGPDVFRDVSLHYSLLGDSADAIVAVAEASLLDIDPRLGPLADNGGPTRTHALAAASPAIDSGDSLAAASVSDLLFTDQRGDGFERIFGTEVDMGAFEYIVRLPLDDEDDDDDDDDNGLGFGGWLLGLLAGVAALRRTRRSGSGRIAEP